MYVYELRAHASILSRRAHRKSENVMMYTQVNLHVAKLGRILHRHVRCKSFAFLFDDFTWIHVYYCMHYYMFHIPTDKQHPWTCSTTHTYRTCMYIMYNSSQENNVLHLEDAATYDNDYVDVSSLFLLFHTMVSLSHCSDKTCTYKSL